jgi:alpha-ketoglutaric semialdehyde dehydrogenase
MDSDMSTTIPQRLGNFIDGNAMPITGAVLSKFNPDNGKLLTEIQDSTSREVDYAIESAASAFHSWSALTPVRRGQILGDVVAEIKRRRSELEWVVATETGKPPQDAAGEVNASILQGEFFAGEGMRLYSRSLTSSMPGKQSHTVRQPIGVAALIVPANTPIANITWKVFPALICGNTAVLKASEDAPYTASLFAQIATDAGLPAGVLNVVQGSGENAGKPLVTHPKISIISFTGSTTVGKWIGGEAGKRLTKVSLELGGKNPMIICDDAHLDNAVKWAALSAFSNAGQRCAAGSRIIIQEKIFDEFIERFVGKAKSLKLGVAAGCDLGPVINAKAMGTIINALENCRTNGGSILCGGQRAVEGVNSEGYYIQPTIISNVGPRDEVSTKELFGPVTCVYKVSSFDEALALANDTEFGLTSAIHTSDINKALKFSRVIRAGVANINLGTFGSEPHMPFGGFGLSGNGTREPGTEAIDIYSELKNISFLEL